MSFLTVNGSNNGVHQPVVLARELFLSPDGQSTILLFPNLAPVTLDIKQEVDKLHSRKTECVARLG